jgi:threonine/homoserine/homoserine lactone efflux protein
MQTGINLSVYEILAVLGLTVFLSLTGVMMPGPVFAATVVKGYKDPKAGIPIALGHGVIEFPLMVGVFFVASWLEDPALLAAIGIVGGIFLIVMGNQMIRFRESEGEEYMPYTSFVAGMVTTLTNPYFFLWWATVGFSLIVMAAAYGAIVIIVFAIVHWSCDLAWDTLVSYTVNKSKRFWTPRSRTGVFVVCGGLLVVFGLYFIVSGFTGF